MIRAEVVHRTDQIHPVVQGGYLPRQRTPSANQSRDPRPESRVQPLDVGGVDHPAVLCLLQQGFDLGLYSLYHTAPTVTPASGVSPAPTAVSCDGEYYQESGPIVHQSQLAVKSSQNSSRCHKQKSPV